MTHLAAELVHLIDAVHVGGGINAEDVAVFEEEEDDAEEEEERRRHPDDQRLVNACQGSG